jgi:hypothetical protein
MRRLLPLAPLLLTSAVLAADPDKGSLVEKPDAFPTLVNPNCSHCRDEAKRRAGELRDDDRVLCWTRGYSDGGAIPFRFFLNSYRVISDSYGVFVHDPDAGFARGYLPSYHFRFHGWRDGVMVMKHKDGTLYSALSGVALDGPKKGTRLTPIPTLVSDWGFWLERYPQAVAYHMFDKYQPVDLPAAPNKDAQASRGPADKRLPADAAVLGLWTGKSARAYPLDALAKAGLIAEEIDGRKYVVLWQPKTKTASAYVPEATPPRKHPAPKPNADGESPPDPDPDTPKKAVTLKRDDKVAAAPFVDQETGSRWDVAGRAVEGELKGYTLTWADSVQVKWFAWAAEYPQTTLYAAAPAPDKPAADPNKAVKEIAGTAEFLRVLPKPFATLQGVDVKARTVTLLIDGEKVAKVWPVEPDAEVKVHGWWGRLEQFRPGDRVWAWLKLDRKKVPVSVVVLADEPSEQDIHGSAWKVTAVEDLVRFGSGKLATTRFTLQAGQADRRIDLPADGPPVTAARGDRVYFQTAADGKARSVMTEKQFEQARAEQKAWLRKRWAEEGLPGTLTFHHVFSGELELTLDHEAMRWGRSLKAGDVVHLTAEPPIKGVVRAVTPWRERTVVRLVVGELESSELKIGQRLGLKMAPPSEADEASAYPPDADRPRAKAERVEWFLASIYCACGVGHDTCTGHFYTLASCNPNGCGFPNRMRGDLGKMIDQGMTDRQIFDELVKKHGPNLTKPHLAP